MGKIHLRAHHLICLQNFEGKGYSPEFVANLQCIVDNLKSHPDDPLIQIVDAEDDLCRHCPFYKKGKCTESKFVEQLDQAYRSLFPKNLSYNQLVKITHEKLKISQFKAACKHCEWFQICFPKITNNLK